MPKPTFYITRAIDYPNGKPHLGHAYEFVVADAIARWHRLAGEDVHFLCGTDEHGQKIEKAAKAAGKEPQQFVDETVPAFKELAKALDVTNDDFIRTSEPRHVKAVQEIFEKLLKQGDIYKGSYEGLYCTGCEAFYTEKDLIEGKCPIHKRELESVKEESYFFRLSKFQDWLVSHIESHPDFILPKYRKDEILNHVREGLRDISVSRTSVTWGVPVLSDPKHTVYVWIDALPNYITALGYPAGKFKKYWPADAHIVGKDINRFHTVIWPCILFALGIERPRTVHSHGFIQVGGEKLSKSTGVRVDPADLLDKYGSDALRYYFLREIPAGEDGSFTEQALIERANGDLADGIGNLLNRVSTLVHKHFSGDIPKPTTFLTIDNDLIEQSNIANDVDALMRKYEWHKAVEKVWDFVRHCNKYLSFTEPWKRAKDNPERLATILYCMVESIRIISVLSWPFVPKLAEKVAAQLGHKVGTLADATFTKETKGKLTETKPVFLKLEKPVEDPFSIVNLKVAEIKDAHPHPNADKLMVLQIHVGQEHRQLVAGIRAWFKPEELKGKRIIIVSNLKPAVLRGVESQGMLLAAEKDGKLALLNPGNVGAGEQVHIEGINPKSEQITIDQFASFTLETKGGHALYNGKPLRTKHGDVTVDIPDGAKIR